MRMCFVLWLFCLLSSCLISDTCGQMISSWKSGDRVLFPEQIDYLQKQAKYCQNENLILWGDGRCYKEYETGPCFAGRVLILDRKLLRPYCKEV